MRRAAVRRAGPLPVRRAGEGAACWPGAARRRRRAAATTSCSSSWPTCWSWTSHLEPLLQAVRVALGRHHQVVVVCAWPRGVPLPRERAAAQPRRETLRRAADGRWPASGCTRLRAAAAGVRPAGRAGGVRRQRRVGAADPRPDAAAAGRREGDADGRAERADADRAGRPLVRDYTLICAGGAGGRVPAAVRRGAGPLVAGAGRCVGAGRRAGARGAAGRPLFLLTLTLLIAAAATACWACRRGIAPPGDAAASTCCWRWRVLAYVAAHMRLLTLAQPRRAARPPPRAQAAGPAAWSGRWLLPARADEAHGGARPGGRVCACCW